MVRFLLLEFVLFFKWLNVGFFIVRVFWFLRFFVIFEEGFLVVIIMNEYFDFCFVFGFGICFVYSLWVFIVRL